MELQRLFPDPGRTTVAQLAGALTGREVLALNMVSSADGRGAVEGRTAALGSPADRELFHALRAHADAVLVGMSTLREERYGPMTKDDRRRAMREAAGLAPDPVGVTLTRSGDVPWDIPLFAEPGTDVVVYAGTTLRPPGHVAARVRARPLLPVDAAMADLRARDGVRSILCEGGPTLNGALLAAGAVDELWLTVAPALAGGRALTIVTGTLPALVRLELLSAHLGDGSLFLRYAVGP